MMKYALVDSEPHEAERGLSGLCRGCGDAMIAKCGEHNVWHWAHKGTRVCDVWWEPETPWHRGWKNQFPKEWQEVIRRADSGEKHIADVMTAGALVLEFQHSHLSKEERESRESFYRNMMWIVNGLRRVRDNPNFVASLSTATVINLNPLTFSFANKGALLRDWSGSRVEVFFDFGDVYEPRHPFPFDAPVLWRLNPASPPGTAQLSPVARARFVEAAQNGTRLGGIDYSGLANRLAAIQRRAR
jgi:hypothetical protein